MRPRRRNQDAPTWPEKSTSSEQSQTNQPERRRTVMAFPRC
jgi:hypothetical protein